MRTHIRIFIAFWLPIVSILTVMEQGHIHSDEKAALGFCKESCSDQSHHVNLDKCFWCIFRLKNSPGIQPKIEISSEQTYLFSIWSKEEPVKYNYFINYTSRAPPRLI
ncbi:MAG: hypothetical protein GWP19_12750 [Planctomycetia bacterium]|nr:hypothetical protein [Planctomycetia bacterium]